MVQKDLPLPPNKRPTIGVLSNWLGDEFPSTILKGIINEAKAGSVNILCFLGRQPKHPEQYAINANVIYDLPGPESVDGLIVLSNHLSHYCADSVVELCNRHRSLPVVSLGQHIDGTISVVVDNEIGSCKAVSHLINEHGLRRIAYAKGPENQLEARDRYRGYVRALAENGLELDPSLVVPGGFNYERAEETVRVLLDERKVEFDAIVAANDLLAAGLIDELQARDIKIPDDVAIIGFDDIDIAVTRTPPLATVMQPIAMLGVEGVRLLLAKINGEPVPDRVVLPTRLITRRSCGCLSSWAAHTKRPTSVQDSTLPIDLSGAWPDAVLEEFQSVVKSRFIRLFKDWPSHLLTSFVEAVQEDNPDHFLAVLTYLLNEIVLQHGDISEWQSIISVIRWSVLPRFPDTFLRERAEDLLHQARILISDSVYRIRVGLEILNVQRISLLRQLIFNLASTIDFQKQLQVLVSKLPQLGIRYGYLALFEDKDPYAERANLVMALTPEQTFIARDGGRSFPTRQIIPPQFRQSEGCTMCTVQLIYYQNEYIGLLVLELDYELRVAYEMIRAVTSAVIKSGWLYQELQSYSHDLESAVREATLELIQSKEQAESILNNSPDAILLLDKEAKINTVNLTCTEVFGYSVEELLGEHPRVLMSEGVEIDLVDNLGQLADSLAPRRFEIIARHKDGGLFDAEVALSPVVDASGFLGAVCTIRDISALKDLERMKDALLSTAAHEFRTPLTTILGFSEILRTRDLTENRRQRYVDFIYRQSTHLSSLVNNLLDVARIQAGRGLVITPRPVDIEPIIKSVVTTYQEISAVHTFRLNNLVPLPEVMGDPLRLDQVMRNLVSNAIKYSPDGGCVTISATTQNGTLEVSVHDEGIGMTAEQQSHLFERFYRADHSNTAVAGAGLGLTICKQIVEKHGGRIWAESEPGKGSTFTFSIPTVHHA
ncbi:MAG: substrate-binding domain-containing protein [Anaerolineae bacterium]|nr:substrate-binding domain-containing protein [Anaerolineae bacterium]